MKEYADGIYLNIPEKEYRALPYVCYSSLKHIAADGKSPAHYKALKDHKGKTTRAMEFGNLVHDAILEPGKFEGIEPLPDTIKQRHGRDWENFKLLHPDVEFLPTAQYFEWKKSRDLAFEIVGRLKQDPVIWLFINPETNYTEVTIIWTDPETGIKCKGRLDALDKQLRHIGDPKTTYHQTPYGVVKDAFTKGYYIQVAMYTDGLVHAYNSMKKKARVDMGFKLDKMSLDSPIPFYYIWIENQFPHFFFYSNAHQCTDERTMDFLPYGFLDYGRKKYKDALNTIKKCEDSYYDGYPITPVDMVIPQWADSGMIL